MLNGSSKSVATGAAEQVGRQESDGRRLEEPSDQSPAEDHRPLVTV